MIEKTDAVVLKSMKYGDTSKIVTFYTRRYGKLNGIAKGARQPKSKYGASLQPLALVSLILYKKETRDLHLISHCDVTVPYKRLQSDFERMGVGLSILEIVNRLAHFEEQHATLFDLLIQTLGVINDSEGNVTNVLPAFQLRCVGLLGFAPDFGACIKCGTQFENNGESKTVMFSLEKGGIFCPRCEKEQNFRTADQGQGIRRTQGAPAPGIAGQHALTLAVGTVRVLNRLCTAPLDSIPRLTYDAQTGNEIRETIRLYYRYHLEELRPLKSSEIFGTL